MNLKTHRDVLEKWQASRLHATETFVSYGPIDPDRWLKIERRVLFLAKEAYGDIKPGKTWDLPELVREEWKRPKYNFWWTLGYWAYGIQRLTNGPIPSSPMAGQLWKEVTESVLASAVVNIKKSGGRSSSNDMAKGLSIELQENESGATPDSRYGARPETAGPRFLGSALSR